MVTPTIKAIETEYGGCLFRSRLEARWAVFFDALGIEWQYEPQGFELSSGRYLPDFFLSHQGTWVEVKGDPAALDTARACKAALELPLNPAAEHVPPAGLRLLLLGDVPAGPAIHCGLVVIDAKYGRGVAQQGVVFVKRRNDAVITRVEYDQVIYEGESIWPGWPDLSIADGVLVDPRTEYAYRAARSARFEFGQSGAQL